VDASTIILGFTGSIGSGCSYIAEFLPHVTDTPYKTYKLSDIIRDELKREGCKKPTVSDLQDKGNELRRKHRGSYLAHKIIEEIEKETKKPEAIIIDGIKNEAEIKILRQFPYFFLFSVHSTIQNREKRCLDIKRFDSTEEFEKIDARDRFEKDDSYGQQVKRCNYLSDIIILNDKLITNIDTVGKKKFIQNIYNKFVSPIEKLSKGKPSPSSFPTADELCMTIAYAQSRMSSCLKRKVGAIVAKNIKSYTTGEKKAGVVTSLPIIISSGYNEVPLGSYKCVYHPKFEKCYRDYLQEEHAKKILFCPNCGTELDIKTKCPHCGVETIGFKKYCTKTQKEIEDEFKCPNCSKQVFKEFLPGEKETPGKLLDMCRALHAEETAILNLTRNGNVPSDNMTLYVTTQPCNLCANKIVSAGIKNVVFDEPYPMEESIEILKAGNVKTHKFEGVKSSAYFRLY